MATVNYDLNSSIDFPPLTIRYTKRYKRRNRKFKDDDHVDTRSQIDELNDTLLELIFVRLSPWKYLVRSKCVSKRWNSIISNPYFVRSLTHEHYPFTLLLRRIDSYRESLGQCVISEHPHFRKNKLCLDFIPTDFDHPYTKFTNSRFVVIVAHNDDLLVACRVSNNYQDTEYCIVNPFTKQYVVVPVHMSSPLQCNWHRMVGIAGVVDGVSTVVTATNNNRGFRIVRIIKEIPTLVVQIYSSKTGQWTTYSFDNYCDIRVVFRKFQQAVTLNNNVHWLMTSKILVINPFDIDIVPPHTLDHPIRSGDYNSMLNVCQNRLRIAHLQKEKQRYDYHSSRIEVWEVEDNNDNDNDNLDRNYNYSAKWRLVINLPLNRSIFERELSPLQRLVPRRKYYWIEEGDQVICCHPNDPHIVYFIYEETLYSYDVLKQRCKVVSYCTSDWTERFVLVHPLIVP